MFFSFSSWKYQKDKKLINRCGHGVSAVAVSSDCIEVVLFGGWRNDLLTADTVIRFGICFSVPLNLML